MVQRVLVDAVNGNGIRLALCEGERNQVVDVEYQIADNLDNNKGHIFLGIITGIQPGLQAAFVDYGGNKSGFLPLTEIHPDYFQISPEEKEKVISAIKTKCDKKGKYKKGKKEENTAEDETNIEDETFDAESSQRELTNSVAETLKPYKIQEVVKKGQVLLVQIVKEARSSKGPTLSTYITLPGRYCVFMPNAFYKGGISKKIFDANERKRLTELIEEFRSKHTNASLVIRTAGAFKTKVEIRRDFEYLLRLWDNIRQHTLESTAPSFIYEEGDIVKQVIRDTYDSDIEEIIIAGEKVYKETINFMNMMLPRHVGKIKLYKDDIPIFAKYNIEEQMSNLYLNQVTLESGGYIVINHTEALIAIDVNSGRGSERSIESTAVKTNLEAAYEIARQAKLRELSGLIVIDFIDMEESSNRRKIEKALKQAFSNDKSKVQIGSIGQFGLLEMSRQMLKRSFLELNTVICSHCQGRGRVRPLRSTALSIIRTIINEIKDQQIRKKDEIVIAASKELIFNLMKKYKQILSKIEIENLINISFEIDENAGADGFFIEKHHNASTNGTKSALTSIDDASYRDSSPSSYTKTDNEQEPQPAPAKEASNKQHFPQRKKFYTEPTKSNIAEEGKEESKDNANRKYHAKPKGKKGARRDNKPPKMESHNRHEGEQIDETENPNQSLLKEIWRKIID